MRQNSGLPSNAGGVSGLDFAQALDDIVIIPKDQSLNTSSLISGQGDYNRYHNQSETIRDEGDASQNFHVIDDKYTNQ